jgi:subtilisin-like proprotein convertase family protein
MGLCITLLVTNTRAQTYTAGGMAVPDDGSTVEIPFLVGGLLQNTIDTISFGLEQVCLTAVHTWISDFDIWLVAPDGTTVLITSAVGGDSDHYTNTCFRHDASTPIAAGSPPYTGTFRPQGQMGRVNNGQDGNGIWKLRIRDTYPFADAGSIISWSLTFGNSPASYFTLHSSPLPIVLIDTEGGVIVDEPKIPARMAIVDNGPGEMNLATGPYNDYDGRIGIEIRGWSSSGAPKRSYGIELWDEDGADISAPLLGMPSEEDWVLSANFYDKSLLNNSLTYTLARGMGRYAARYRHVEVILDGEYVGVYVFMEQIKRDGERVNIARLDSNDIAGDDVTGGYIFKIDKYGQEDGGWTSSYTPIVSNFGQTIRFLHVYPRTDRIRPEQAAYLSAYVDSFETAIAGSQFTDPVTGYAHYLDVGSVVDVFLLNELSRNVDGYRLSTYLHKQRDSQGGKLRMGPVWDYDIAWGNANYCNGSSITGWAHSFGSVCPQDPWQIPFWWVRLLQDPSFRLAVKCRWNELREDLLSIPSLHQYCDSMALLLDEAQQRNFTVWQILGVPVWPNPTPVPTTYAGEITELKDWISARWNWLDGAIQNMGPACTSGFDEALEAPLQVYPNPFEDHVILHPWNAQQVTVQLVDPLGRVLMPARQFTLTGPVRLDLPTDLQPGGYILVVRDQAGRQWSHRLLRF